MSQELFWKDPQGNWVKCDTPEKSKSMHLERIRKKHEALEKEGFLCSLGWRMDIGTEHASLLDGGIRYAELKGQATITIRDWNNERHEDVPLEDAKGILQEIVERQMTLLYGKWSLQERVRSASRWEDIETLEAEYERGW